VYFNNCFGTQFSHIICNTSSGSKLSNCLTCEICDFHINGNSRVVFCAVTLCSGDAAKPSKMVVPYFITTVKFKKTMDLNLDLFVDLVISCNPSQPFTACRYLICHYDFTFMLFPKKSIFLEHTFKCVLYNFSYLTGLHINLLQKQIYCC